MAALSDRVLTIHLPMPLNELTELAKVVDAIWPESFMVTDSDDSTMLHVYRSEGGSR